MILVFFTGAQLLNLSGDDCCFKIVDRASILLETDEIMVPILVGSESCLNIEGLMVGLEVGSATVASAKAKSIPAWRFSCGKKSG
jgi:hypothetical protein